MTRPQRVAEIVGFLCIGLFSTAVHFLILFALVEFAGLPAGLSSALASVVGTATAYVGNRWFVFQAATPAAGSLARFAILYLAIAVLHGTALSLWTDIAGLPYSVGFIGTTIIAVIVSYLGNRYFVFPG